MKVVERVLARRMRQQVDEMQLSFIESNGDIYCEAGAGEVQS